MKRMAGFVATMLISLAMVALLVVAVNAQSPTPPLPPEMALSDVSGETASWQVFTGTWGFTIRYSPNWEIIVDPGQGHAANTHIVEFRYALPNSYVILEVRETVLPPGTDWHTDPEVSLWHVADDWPNYHLETVSLNGQDAWLAQLKEAEILSLQQMIFTGNNDRLYSFRLHSSLPMSDSVWQTFALMLGTFQPGNGPVKLEKPYTAFPFRGTGILSSLNTSASGYDRAEVYQYAQTYHNQNANNDGCYLWYTSTAGVDCTWRSGAIGVDGAHFVNRAVNVGGRPIPNWPQVEGAQVAALRDWLVNDGWTIVPTTSAQIGDVVIVGPWGNPCWAGVVVSTGNDPYVATHSNNGWWQASTVWCTPDSTPSYEKTYLHYTFRVYLPIVIKNYPPPPPIKTTSGLHLGSRNNDWTAAMLQPADGDNGGVWPQSVVVLSSQIYNLGRPHDPTGDNPDCMIVNVDLFKPIVFEYLKRASANGVKVLIRISPSPGNFQDWDDPLQQNHHLLSSGGPAGGGYCYYNGHQNQVRHIGDLVQEIAQIHAYNVRHGLWEYAFMPANEPNIEWYTTTLQSPASPKLNEPVVWQEMDAYFSKLYQQVHAITPPPDLVDKWGTVRLLTPPMAQENFAEGIDLVSCSKEHGIFSLIDETSGYGNMTATFQTANDGIAWHNYWRYGYEWTGGCNNFGDHLYSMADPLWMRDAMRTNPKGNLNFIVEADLASPEQMKHTNSLKDKNADSSATAQSVREFFYYENALANAWLLSYEDIPGQFNAEIHWHEAYSNTTGMLPWFLAWWNGSEQP